MEIVKNKVEDDGYYSNGNPSHDYSSELKEIFERELKEIYWIEKSMLHVIPGMVRKSGSENLMLTFERHLNGSAERISRLEQVFELTGIRREEKISLAIESILKENNDVIERIKQRPALDAAIITAVHKLAHFQIASYKALKVLATLLEMKKAVPFIQDSLDEEIAADKELSGVAERLKL